MKCRKLGVKVKVDGKAQLPRRILLERVLLLGDFTAEGFYHGGNLPMREFTAEGFYR